MRALSTCIRLQPIVGGLVLVAGDDASAGIIGAVRLAFCSMMGRTPISLSFPIHARIFLEELRQIILNPANSSVVCWLCHLAAT